jgi:hypothetical protein
MDFIWIENKTKLLKNVRYSLQKVFALTVFKLLEREQYIVKLCSEVALELSQLI